MAAPSKLGKDALLDIVTEGYKAGIGPKILGKLTGYSSRTIERYASTLDLHLGSGHRAVVPNPVPRGFLMAMARAGLAMDKTDT